MTAASSAEAVSGRRAGSVGVVGAGILGLCTAWALLERGIEVVVYERAAPGQGQSAGASRIFRHVHGDARLVQLAAASRRLYREWEAALGVELLAADGELTIGPDAEDNLARLQQVPDVRARIVDGAEAVVRLPLLAAVAGPVLLDETAGAIRARAAIDALRTRIGSRLVADEVQGIRPSSTGVEVRTGAHVAVHPRVVVCAGIATASLVRPLGLSLPLRLGIQVRLTFERRDGALDGLPCVQDGSGQFGETAAYGVPLPDGRRYAVGLTEEVGVREDGSVVDPAGVAALEDRITAYVDRALPGLVPTPVGRRQCWTTAVAWDDSGVAIWEVDRVAAVAGHHLFKHAPALGRALAAVGAGDEVPTDLRPDARLGAGGG